MPSRSFFIVALAILVVGYLCVNLLLRWSYPRQLFPYRGSSYETLPGLLSTVAPDGNQIAFVHLPLEDQDAPLLFYLHGNGEDLGHNADRFEWFGEQGYSVIALDYPGYGLSTGEPTAESVRQATAAVWNFAREQLGAQARDTVIWGRSIGSAPAAWLGATDEFRGLILESAFRSIFSVANLPFPVLLREPFPTEALLPLFDGPVFLFHGEKDFVIPVDHARKLAGVVGENATLVLLPEGSHNDLRFVGLEEMEAALASLRDRSTH